MNKVYLVGAGPAGPGLITVKGLEILRQAEVVIYDYLVDKRIISEAKEGAELICCDTLRKERRHSDGFLIDQEKINDLMVRRAKAGKKVIRLKNGDPSIFGRLSQELGALVKNRIEFEIVPGVTAASAAASFSGIPLTDRRFASSVVFATGHEEPGKKNSSLDWNSLAKCGTIALYMGVENLSKIAGELTKAGKSVTTPVTIVKDAGLITQRSLSATLGQIVKRAKDEKIKAPSIIIIGEVAKLGKAFNWLNKNKRILFTGLSKERFFIKGTYFHLPLINIKPISDYAEFDNYLRDIRKFDWIIFTSRFGAQYFFERLGVAGFDSRALKDINIASIGDSTSRKLLDFGIRADFLPKIESSEGLLAAFKRINIKGRRIFLPRSDISDKGLTGGLIRLGARVSASVAYKNIPANDLPDLDLNSFDEVMFTSPSGVRNFIKRYGKLPREVKISCIGRITESEARKWHLLS